MISLLLFRRVPELMKFAIDEPLSHNWKPTIHYKA